MIGSGMLEWEPGYPKLDDLSRSCIAWNSLKIMNTKCDGSEDYHKSSVAKYYKGELNEPYDEALFLRGYLCEANTIHTTPAYNHAVIYIIVHIHNTNACK